MRFFPNISAVALVVALFDEDFVAQAALSGRELFGCPMASLFGAGAIKVPGGTMLAAFGMLPLKSMPKG